MDDRQRDYNPPIGLSDISLSSMGDVPPPSYSAVTGQSFPLSYVDFLPEILDSGGFFKGPTYERFDYLMSKANNWLCERPSVKVLTCESVELKQRGGATDSDKSTFFEYGKSSNFFIRILRLWIVPKGPKDSSLPQQIGYVNIVPECYDSGGVFSDPKFESFGQALSRFNDVLKAEPMEGRILNVETQDFKFQSWNGCDPDKSQWMEYGEGTTYFLNVIRIFYEIGTPGYEEIGCVDFIPECLQQGGFLSKNVYEPLHAVGMRVQAWLARQTGIAVTNVQSIDYKVSNSFTAGENIDSHRSLFREYGKRTTSYLRIIRVCYTKPFASGGLIPPDRPVTFTYRTFSPVALTDGGMFVVPYYETQSQNMDRMHAWLRATNARVISVETVPIRMYSGNQHGRTEATYTWNRGERSEHWLYVFRVFLDGIYAEPPPEALPPLPQIQPQSDDCCCTLM